MRVVFQDGIIYASYTDKEVENIGEHKHQLIEMTPQELRLLHDDVTNVVTERLKENDQWWDKIPHGPSMGD